MRNLHYERWVMMYSLYKKSDQWAAMRKALDYVFEAVDNNPRRKIIKLGSRPHYKHYD